MESGERKTRQVILLTAVTMVIEIIAGSVYGSMALLVAKPKQPEHYKKLIEKYTRRSHVTVEVNQSEKDSGDSNRD